MLSTCLENPVGWMAPRNPVRIYVIGTLLLLISDLKTFNSSVQLLFGWQPSRNRRWLMILFNNLSSGSFKYMPRQFEGFFLNSFLCKHFKFTSYHYLEILSGLSKLQWSYLGAFDIGSLHYYRMSHQSFYKVFETSYLGRLCAKSDCLVKYQRLEKQVHAIPNHGWSFF